MIIPYVRIAGEFFNTPLALAQPTADVIEAYLLSRMNGDETKTLDRPVDAAARNPANRPYSVDQGIALIGINGELVNRGAWLGASSGLTSYEGIAAQIKAAAADPSVNGILLEINSPGGSVAGMAGLQQAMSQASKPIWSIANSSAASAGYWTAAGAERIAVIPDGMVGSIGAIIVMRDLTKAMDKAGVSAVIVRSGDRKARGSGLEAMDEATIARAQALVDEAGNAFIDAIATSRGIDRQKIIDLQGEMLTAAEAKKAGLVDVIATVPDFHLAMVAAMRKAAKPAAGSLRAAATPLNHTQSKGNTMSDFTQTDLDAAKASGHSDGIAAERARISAILGCTEAAGKPKLAQHLALKTATSADDARSLLAVAAAEAPAASDNPLAAPPNLLKAAMENGKNDNPKVAADIGGQSQAKAPGEPETEAEKIARQKAEVRASLGVNETK